MFRVLISLVLVLSLSVFSGCRSNKGGSHAGGGMGNTTLIGDSPLPGGDFSLLTPITNVRFETIRFSYDSFKIAPGEIRKIEKVAAYMRSNRTARLVSEGHCDERGSKEYNLSLGENRGLSVRAYLVELGVSSAHIQTRSYGEEQPANPSHNASAWSANRRVEFALYR
jgi:peptidoglycan-associated lipoprotein